MQFVLRLIADFRVHEIDTFVEIDHELFSTVAD